MRPKSVEELDHVVDLIIDNAEEMAKVPKHRSRKERLDWGPWGLLIEDLLPRIDQANLPPGLLDGGVTWKDLEALPDGEERDCTALCVKLVEMSFGSYWGDHERQRVKRELSEAVLRMLRHTEDQRLTALDKNLKDARSRKHVSWHPEADALRDTLLAQGKAEHKVTAIIAERLGRHPSTISRYFNKHKK